MGRGMGNKLVLFINANIVYLNQRSAWDGTDSSVSCDEEVLIVFSAHVGKNVPSHPMGQTIFTYRYFFLTNNETTFWYGCVAIYSSGTDT
jgi:hypothetical protein